jgi:hypothetical protein
MSGEHDMRKIFAAALILGFAASLQAQSLVELSRREKARRESFKGRLPAVVTNNELAALRKAPAMSSPAPDTAPQEAIPTVAGGPRGPGGEAAGPMAPSGGRRIVPRVLPSGPSLVGEDGLPGGPSTAGDREARLRAVREEADLLTTKMNGLLQRFYRNDDMTPRDVIEREIAETYARIDKAREAESALLEELEKQKAAKDERPRGRDSGPRTGP